MAKKKKQRKNKSWWRKAYKTLLKMKFISTLIRFVIENPDIWDNLS